MSKSEDEQFEHSWSGWPGPDDEPVPPTVPIPNGRGGPQRIPRPHNAQPGNPPPWARLSPDERRLTLADVRAAFAHLGPPMRSERELVGAIRRPSAVLAPIYDDDHLGHVVLTRRTLHLSSHAGEVSFPGGRVEPGETIVDGARRETHEEVGIEPDTVEILGELDHLSTVSSDSFIAPYVGALSKRPVITPSPAEVEAVLLVPLAELADPAHYREELWVFPDGVQHSIHFFELEGDTVWGATAAMLRQFLGILTGTLGRGDLGHP